MSALPTDEIGVLDALPMDLMREPVISMRSPASWAKVEPASSVLPSATRTPVQTWVFLNM